MKYFSKKVKTPHGVFDSRSEYNRYLLLKSQEDAGIISDLKRQVRFEIIPKLTRTDEVQLKTKTKSVERVEERPAHYTCDFAYYDHNGRYVIEELKSEYTKTLEDYKLRKKLMKHLIFKHNMEVGFEDWIFKEIVSK